MTLQPVFIAGSSPLAGSGLGAFAAVVASISALATLSDVPGVRRSLCEASAPKARSSKGSTSAALGPAPATEDPASRGTLQDGATLNAPAATAVDPTGKAAEPAFRVIPRAEVEQHAGEEQGIWVTFGEGVYDVTSFVSKHPGGNKILMAAGGALEPFWAMYAQHKQPAVRAPASAHGRCVPLDTSALW